MWLIGTLVVIAAVFALALIFGFVALLFFIGAALSLPARKDES